MQVASEVNPNKIFGIGLSRTATTSLTDALRILGFRAIHYPDLRDHITGGDFSLSEFEPFDAMTDTPVALIYGHLLDTFPNSRFVLTTRDRKSWLESCERFFSSKDLGKSPERLEKDHFFRKRVYGFVKFRRESWAKVWDRHHFEVARLVPPNRLLVVDFIQNPSWSPLCDFLEVRQPKVPFPHLHRMT